MASRQRPDRGAGCGRCGARSGRKPRGARGKGDSRRQSLARQSAGDRRCRRSGGEGAAVGSARGRTRRGPPPRQRDEPRQRRQACARDLARSPSQERARRRPHLRSARDAAACGRAHARKHHRQRPRLTAQPGAAGVQRVGRRHARDHAGAPPGHRCHVLKTSDGKGSTSVLRTSATPALKLPVMRSDVFAEAKIDCHVHGLDPARFPDRADTHYAPTGQEIGTPAQLARVMDAYGTRHALLVGPNSGYGLDNACMLDTIARGEGRYKGIAVVANDATLDELRALKRAGVVGVAWNVTHYGLEHYRDAQPLLERLVALDMLVDIQVEHEQLSPMMPMLADSGVRILVDHCGRPTVDAGLDDPGFRALLELGTTGRAFVKLSGFVKFSHKPAPYDDAWPFVAALIDAFTLDHCLWASDWPYLRAPVHVDYGVLLHLVLKLVPEATDCRRLFWDTPRELFGFAG